MNGDAKNQPAPSEDIDLFLLIERSILFFRKYRWVFIAAIILGISAGFYFYNAIAKTYKSRMIVHSFLLSNQEEIQIVNNWNELLKKKEYDELKTVFHCNGDILHKVKRIKAEEIQLVFSQANPNGFTIDVLVTDNAVLEELQKGIIYGFENIGYIKRRLDVKKGSLNELISKTSAEIQKLDSTKKILENIIRGKGNSSSSLIIDGSSVNRQLIEMNEKLLSFRESLQFTNAVQVLQDFKKFRKPDGPKLIPWLVIGLLFFLSLGYIYALVSSIKEGLKARAGKREKSNESTV
jgi:hypothetical protein